MLFIINFNQGMKQVEVMISGPSPKRDITLWAIWKSDVILNFVGDMTPMPHNGCKIPLKKHV
jgi:small subunit ribosomal protein S11